MIKRPAVATVPLAPQVGSSRPELRTLSVLGLIFSCLAGRVGVVVSAVAFLRSWHHKQSNPSAVAGIIVGLAATSVFIAGVYYFHAVVSGVTGVCAEQGPGTHDGPTGTFTCPSNRQTPMPLSSFSRLFAAVLLLTGIILTSVVGIARPAAAHDALAGSTPATGETVTTTFTTVTVTFSEPPLADFASALALKVTGPTGATVTTGAPTAESASLTAPVTITRAGVHTVTWQSVSSDGHPVSGTFTFTYAGPLSTAEPKPTPTPTPTRTTGLSDTESTAAQPPSEAPEGGTAFAPAALIVGTLLALVLGAVIWLTRRRGGPTAPAHPDADE